MFQDSGGGSLQSSFDATTQELQHAVDGTQVVEDAVTEEGFDQFLTALRDLGGLGQHHCESCIRQDVPSRGI